MTEAKKSLKRRLREADIQRHNTAYLKKNELHELIMKSGGHVQLQTSSSEGKSEPLNVVLDVKRFERIAREDKDVKAGKISVEDKFTQLLHASLT